MKILIKVIGVFLIVLFGFAALGYYFYTRLGEPNNAIVFLIMSHLGLIFGIYLGKKTIPKKVLAHKKTESEQTITG
ncbi:MAG: hypothetical protein ACKVQB_01715 [Bacteroidia bacterium]